MTTKRMRDMPIIAFEKEILELMATGHTNLEISHKLGWAPDTIKKYIANICAKLGARDRTHAVACAFREGIL